MRTINPFPAFSREECDDLRKKIVHGIVMETFTASPIAHRNQASAEGKTWPTYPCWIHSAQWEDGKGFKKFKFKGHTLYIHRASCQLFNGPILSTHLVDHLCRVHGCCQPAHLEAVTPTENIKRGANQNHLLRKGEKPPCAKDINPRFFSEPAIQEVNYEGHRRAADGRDGPPRYWEDNGGNPPPTPPAGFFWEKATGWTVGYTHVLQPVREKDYGLAQGYPAAIEMAEKGAPIFVPVPDPVPVLEMDFSHIEQRAMAYNASVQAFDEQTKIIAAMAPVGPEEGNRYCDDAGCETPRAPRSSFRSWLRRKWHATKTWLDKPVGSNG